MASSVSPIAAAVAASDHPDRIDILLEASEVAAARTLDFDALMAALARLVRKIVDYQMYSVLVPTDDGRLRIAHSVGYSDDLVRTLRVPVGEGITGTAARTLNTVRADDVNRVPSYVRAVESVRSELAVPLVARDRLVAVLDLQSADPKAFDSRVSAMLELVASRFSLAIDVCQLYHAQAKQHSVLGTLRKIAQEFAHILQLGDLLQEISHVVHALIRYDVLAIYLKEQGKPLLRHYFGVKFQERVNWKDIEVGSGLVGTAAATREAVLVPDTSLDPRYIESEPSVRSEVAVPLILKSELIGVLDLECVRRAGFSKEDMHTLMLLAPQVAAAIENARLYEEKARSEARLEEDLVAARALQSHMLPQGVYRAPGIEIAARNVPASVVSGDFYDFYDRGESVGILNGDVSGKGAAAALYAALANGLLRTAAGAGLAPARLFERVNEALLDRQFEARFLAAHYFNWEAPAGRLVMTAAGMPFPYVCRDGLVRPVRMEGVPLGLFRSAAYDEVTVRLRPGDFVVSVSDGVSETVDALDQPYGEQRLLGILKASRDQSAETILERIFDDLGTYCGGCSQVDDRTAIVLRVTE